MWIRILAATPRPPYTRLGRRDELTKGGRGAAGWRRHCHATKWEDSHPQGGIGSVDGSPLLGSAHIGDQSPGLGEGFVPGFARRDGFHGRQRRGAMRSRRASEERQLHIAWLELGAILHALRRTFGPRLGGTQVLLRRDNTQ